MIEDIHDLDDDADRMRACWKKARNFIATFAGDYFRVTEQIKTGRYGNDWNHHKWLLLKVGTSEEVVLQTLKAFERALATEQRDWAERERVISARRRREEKERVRAAREDRARAREDAVMVKNNAAYSQAAWDEYHRKYPKAAKERRSPPKKPEKRKRVEMYEASP